MLPALLLLKCNWLSNSKIDCSTCRNNTGYVAAVLTSMLQHCMSCILAALVVSSLERACVIQMTRES